METIPLGRLEVVPLERVQLSVGRDGCMHGFSGWLASLQPYNYHLSAVLEALRADWIYLKETGLLARDFDVGEYHLSDVCVFLILLPQARNQRCVHPTRIRKSVEDARKSLLQALMTTVASKVDAYILHTYHTLHNVHA